MANGRYYEEIYLIHKVFNYIPIVPIISIIILLSVVGPDLIFSKQFLPLCLGTIVIVMMPLIMGRMVIKVEGYELIVSFGYLGWITKKFSAQEIISAEVVTYHPIREFGGWGIRYGKFRGERTGCYSMSGNRGLFIILAAPRKTCFVSTNKFIIGTKQPEKLKAAIGK